MRVGSLGILGVSLAVSVLITHSMLADVVARRGTDELIRGNMIAAERFERRALILDSRSSYAEKWLVKIERSNGEQSRALADASAYLSRGFDVDVAAERGRTLFGLKRYADAALQFESIFAKDAGSPQDSLFGVVSWRLAGDQKRAHEFAVRATSRFPDDDRFRKLARITG